MSRPHAAAWEEQAADLGCGAGSLALLTAEDGHDVLGGLRCCVPACSAVPTWPGAAG